MKQTNDYFQRDYEGLDHIIPSSTPSTERVSTPLMELIEWLDRQIENNFIRDSPIQTELNQSPYKILKHKCQSLLPKERI